MRVPPCASGPTGSWASCATSDPESGNRPERIWAVGIAADDEHAFAHAMTAMQSLAETRDAKTVLNVGVLLGNLRRFEDAIGVFDQVVGWFGDATEPALRELATMAQRTKAEMGSGAELT